MKNQEYLSEERYQQSSIKIKKVGKVLLIIGVIVLVLGFIFLMIGFLGFGSSALNGLNSFENGAMIGTMNGAFGSFGLFTLGSAMLSLGFAVTIAGGITMFFAHRREITAYTTQQVMPIAQEGIEKMAPTVGSAIGTIGKELAKGIKQGINEADKEENK